jgi:hypothetical protein
MNLWDYKRSKTKETAQENFILHLTILLTTNALFFDCFLSLALWASHRNTFPFQQV